MTEFTLTLTDEEMEVVYDALEELRLTGGWTNDNAEMVANNVQDKIFYMIRKRSV